jgi:hypothetical protein
MRAQLASIQVCLSGVAVTDNKFDLALSLQLPDTAQLFGSGWIGVSCVAAGGRGSDGGARRRFSMLPSEWMVCK